MLKLHVVQAEYGDCFIIESGPPSKPKYILIDGGPDTIYAKCLQGELIKIRQSGGQIDLVILSHIDNDHIIGLLDLLAEIQSQRVNDQEEIIAVKELWLNSFAQTIGSGNDIEARFNSLVKIAGALGQSMTIAGATTKGIGEGYQLRTKALLMNIPINKEFPNGVVLADNAPSKIEIGGLRIQLIGPTIKGLENLRKKWMKWLKQYEDKISQAEPSSASKADTSVPNLSSIMIHAEAEGKKLIFPGDGLGSDILQGLKQTGFLGSQKSYHVDIFKLPHHGSERNVTERFLETVTADTYILSANGKDGNPDLNTLIWLIRAAKKQNRKITIFVTNETESTQDILQMYPPATHGYELRVAKKTSSATEISI